MVVWTPAVPNVATMMVTNPEELNLSGNVPMFAHVPAGGFTAQTFGPDFACGGTAHTTEAYTDGDYQSVSLTMLKVHRSPKRLPLETRKMAQPRETGDPSESRVSQQLYSRVNLKPLTR